MIPRFLRIDFGGVKTGTEPISAGDKIRRTPDSVVEPSVDLDPSTAVDLDPSTAVDFDPSTG